MGQTITVRRRVRRKKTGNSRGTRVRKKPKK